MKRVFTSLIIVFLLNSVRGEDVKPLPAMMKNPELVSITKPPYPEVALRHRIQGEVIVNVHLDKDGKPLSAKVVRSSSFLLEDAAVEAAMNARFKPAIGLRGPVKSLVQVPFSFKIR